ncbi:MAG: hypothetical protein QOE61_2006 [Micromonosporaceae bacterium]|nr:hypothetical protein [Micromonosporaceae bacterium]
MLIELRLLGSVELYVGGHAVALGPAKRRAMLAALALERNQLVSLDRLGKAVWAGLPPRSAVANLRTHAAALRRILGDRIVAVSGGYQLRAEASEVDAYAFLQLAEEGRAALGADDPRTAARRLTVALGLWRGAAAGEGLPHGTRLDVQFEGLDEHRLKVFEDLVEARLSLAEHDKVLPALRQHVACHPLRERARGQLMLALYRSGELAAALEAYHNARTTLGDELGVEPGPELVAMHRAMLERSPALSPRTLSPGPASLGPLSSGPLSPWPLPPRTSEPAAVSNAALQAAAGAPLARRRLGPDIVDLAGRAEVLAAELAALAAAMQAAAVPFGPGRASNVG